MSWEDTVKDLSVSVSHFFWLFSIKVTMSPTQALALTLAGAFKKMLVPPFLSGKNTVQG